MLSTTPIASQHAVQRLRERHCPELSHSQAEAYLLKLAVAGRARPTGRHWLKRTHRPTPGTTYVISAADPDVALVMSGRIICTVLVRSMAQGKRHDGQQQVVPLETYRRWRKADLQRELVACWDASEAA